MLKRKFPSNPEIFQIKTLKQQNTKKFGIFKISMETS